MTEYRPKVKRRFLADAVERKRAEVAARRTVAPESALRARAEAATPVRPWAAALRGGGRPRVVAEFKRSSPAAGPLADGADVAERIAVYADAGAAAVSVLTDAAFDGSLEDLESAARAARVPVLRKDFLVDPYQVWESRAAGADAVLVVVAAVDDGTLTDLVGAIGDAGLGWLAEIHDPAEIERLAPLEPSSIGVNARDLATLEVSLERGLAAVSRVRAAVDRGTALVAESGIRTPGDVARAEAAGADAVLVGEALMRAPDPRAALEALVRGEPGR